MKLKRKEIGITIDESGTSVIIAAPRNHVPLMMALLFQSIVKSGSYSEAELMMEIGACSVKAADLLNQAKPDAI